MNSTTMITTTTTIRASKPKHNVQQQWLDPSQPGILGLRGLKAPRRMKIVNSPPRTSLQLSQQGHKGSRNRRDRSRKRALSNLPKILGLKTSRQDVQQQHLKQDQRTRAQEQGQ